MNNDNGLNLHLHDQMPIWLGYIVHINTHPPCCLAIYRGVRISFSWGGVVSKLDRLTDKTMIR